MKNKLITKVNGTNRTINIQEDRNFKIFSTDVTYAGKSYRLNDDTLRDRFDKVGLSPGGLEQGLHEANSENGYDYGFNDAAYMSTKEWQKANCCGSSEIWIGTDQAEKGEVSKARIELSKKTSRKMGEDNLVNYAVTLLDVLARFIEDEKNYITP